MTNETPVAEVSVEDAAQYLYAKLSERGKVQVEADVINPIELAKALDCKPQMLYSYIRDGRLKAHTTEDTQKIVIKLDDALEYVRGRLERARKAAEKSAAGEAA